MKFDIEPEWYISEFLAAIRARLVMKSMGEDEDSRDNLDPFGNTGVSFKNGAFEVHAFDWDESHDQKYNFKWNDFEVSWYKYFYRGMTQNREMGMDEAVIMLTDCLDSLSKTPVLWVCWCNVCGMTVEYRGAVPKEFICACETDNVHKIYYDEWE